MGLTVSIGVVARRTGCGIDAIRFYEKSGIVQRAQRAENGRRVYRDADIARIFFIKRARELGFSLDEVRSLLSLGDAQENACAQVQSLANQHLADIAAKIADLIAMQTVLTTLVADCARGDALTCPLITALSEGGTR